MFALYTNLSKDDIKQKALEYWCKWQNKFPPEFSAILIVHAYSLKWLWVFTAAYSINKCTDSEQNK